MENPIKMDDLGVPLFLETPISTPKRKLSMGFFFSHTAVLPHSKSLAIWFRSWSRPGDFLL